MALPPRRCADAPGSWPASPGLRADDDAEAVAAQAACVAASREAPAGSRFAFAGFEGMAAKFGGAGGASQRPQASETTIEFDEPPRRPAVIAVANPAGVPTFPSR
ncbi:MAG: hypothetical protein ACLTEX_00815 [Eggerthella lenta]